MTKDNTKEGGGNAYHDPNAIEKIKKLLKEGEKK